MIADEAGFKHNFRALLMIDRGCHVPLAFKNVVSLGFDVLGTHSESVSKKIEDKN